MPVLSPSQLKLTESTSNHDMPIRTAGYNCHRKSNVNTRWVERHAKLTLNRSVYGPLSKSASYMRRPVITGSRQLGQLLPYV